MASREIILAPREPGGFARAEKRGIIGQYGPRLSIIGPGLSRAPVVEQKRGHGRPT